MIVNIIGAGIAGCECADILARNDIYVRLYEMKRIKKTDAHKSDYFSELVCSNSLKSESITNACGLLKKEMSYFNSLFIEAAYQSKVEAGQALAVDREKFSRYITKRIRNNENIEIIEEEVTNVLDVLKRNEVTVIATGPLTTEPLSKSIKTLLGHDSLFFYDAAAPIVEADSIDMTKAFKMDRYGDKEGGDYINLGMNKEEYLNFYNNLVNAKVAERKDFDKLKLFEGCMPIEHMAKRGEKTLTFGMLKPVGLNNPKTGEKYYAVAQLRSENIHKTAYNLVGFQTSLTFGEQKRVFSMLPGLENANFLRYGVMHKNVYINANKVVDKKLKLKKKYFKVYNDVYFAGQISGVEGYVESAASGMTIAINILSKLHQSDIEFSDETMIGALSKYVATENEDYQPMNANFGIIRPLTLEDGVKKIDKKTKYERYANRSIAIIEEIKRKLSFPI